MEPPRRPGKMLACALLAAAVLVTVPDALRAQERTVGNAPARILERPSEAMAAAQRQRVRQIRQHRRLQRLRMEQARAHARMPDTMYASTVVARMERNVVINRRHSAFESPTVGL